MDKINFEAMKFISPMFFYHRVYLNGNQIFLDDKSIERYGQILENFEPNIDFEIFIKENIRKIFDIPKDDELLNQDDETNKNDFYFSSPIFNSFSQNFYKSLIKEFSLFDCSGLKLLNECKKYKLFEYPQKNGVEDKDYYSLIIIGDSKQNK